MAHFVKEILIVCVKAYQYCISPFFGACCRFYPSCSNYALEALSKKTLIRALVLIIKRVSCCHPWHNGGIDLIENTENQTNESHSA